MGHFFFLECTAFIQNQNMIFHYIHTSVDNKKSYCVVILTMSHFHHSIIAVSYEARKFGVSRNMRGDDAKKKCPNVNLIYVQENRGKADLTIYREAGAEVIKVLSSFSDALERASIDEAYIDLTDTIKRYNIVIFFQW